MSPMKSWVNSKLPTNLFERIDLLGATPSNSYLYQILQNRVPKPPPTTEKARKYYCSEIQRRVVVRPTVSVTLVNDKQ